MILFKVNKENSTSMDISNFRKYSDNKKKNPSLQ